MFDTSGKFIEHPHFALSSGLFFISLIGLWKRVLNAFQRSCVPTFGIDIIYLDGFGEGVGDAG